MDSRVQEEGKGAEVVVTKKAFNLACSWVQKMSGGSDFDAEEESKDLPSDDVADVRPVRLGLGAKYLSHSQVNRVSSQVDKKLRAKLIPTARVGLGVRRDDKSGSRVATENSVHAEDQEDEEEDYSRASNFKKRSSAFVRPTMIVSETTGSKKKKRKGATVFS